MVGDSVGAVGRDKLTAIGPTGIKRYLLRGLTIASSSPSLR